MSADTFGQNSNQRNQNKTKSDQKSSGSEEAPNTERETLATPQNLDDIPSQNTSAQEEEMAEVNGIQLVGVSRCLSFDEAMSRYSDNPYRPWGFQMLY